MGGNTESGFVMDINREWMDAGNKMILYDKKGADRNGNQQIQGHFEGDADDFNLVARQKPELAFGDDGNGNVVLQDTATAPKLEQVATEVDGCTRIRRVDNGKCLSTRDGEKWKGVDLVWADCDSEANIQEFCWDKADLQGRRLIKK